MSIYNRDSIHGLEYFWAVMGTENVLVSRSGEVVERLRIEFPDGIVTIGSSPYVLTEDGTRYLNLAYAQSSIETYLEIRGAKLVDCPK